MLEKLKKNAVASKYIGSGLLQTGAHIVSGVIVLRWVEPENLGQWQSFTVFIVYIHLLTLGVTSGLNRELPYLLGKGDEKMAMNRLKTAGYYTTVLSLSILGLVLITAILLKYLAILTINQALMMFFAFSMGAIQIQTSFLGATYRSSDSFNRLTQIQLLNTFLLLLLVPLIYFFQIWGYISFQIIVAYILYAGYQYFRPYKVKYEFDMRQLKILVKIGSQMYFWNYIRSATKTVPRLILVVFGSPLMVGLFAPAENINKAIENFPKYIVRYILPQMSYKYGKSDDINEVYNYAMTAVKYLFLVMISGGLVLTILIPFIFPIIFPKYVEGILAAQIAIFAGVFYSINAILHNTLNSIKELQFFKYILGFRFIYIIFFSGGAYLLLQDLLTAVALGAALTELFNIFNYLYFLRKLKNA